jgi:hypothetical protein
LRHDRAPCRAHGRERDLERDTTVSESRSGSPLWPQRYAWTPKYFFLILAGPCNSRAMANRHLRPPLTAMGQGRGVYGRLRVLRSVHPQRAALGWWWVHVWSALTHTQWPPWHPVRRRRTADARRVRAVHGPPTPPHAWLVCSEHHVAAPRRRRRPHSSHTDCHHCHRQLTCPVSLHRYHPHHPLTHQLRHT